MTKLEQYNIHIKLLSYLPFWVLVFLMTGCSQNREDRNVKTKQIVNVIEDLNEVKQIRKATYYLENSESMLGYVNGFTEFVDVVSELAEKPQFVEENIFREFYFINGAGANIRKTYIGNNPSKLKSKLNPTGFRVGDITKSDLNNMFQIALDNAGGDSISIIFSDCIYDIGQSYAPFNALATEGKGTRSIFIKRLINENIQTVIIKLHSQFKGHYFPVSKRGRIPIAQTRPYYILIFGEYDLMNKYFNDEYISKLKGFDAMARFFKSKDVKIPYHVTAENLKGSFRFDRNVSNKLIEVEPDRQRLDFQFSIAVDFSALPLSKSYLESIQNYSCSENYSVSEITPSVKKSVNVNFTPTHLITTYAQINPYGKLEISLNHSTPSWINETNSIDDKDIKNDTTQTIGFKFLTDAIREAYEHVNHGKRITTFNVEIIK